MSDDQKTSIPSPGAHLLLLAVSLAPLAFPVHANALIILTASLTVWVGSCRSIKPEPPSESMSKKDAMRFPIIGSAILLGLFLLFKFLPKELVNRVLTLYFVLLGLLAVTSTLCPFITHLLPAEWGKREVKLPRISIPYLLKEPLDLEATMAELVSGVCSLPFCVWYFSSKHWTANNALGLAFSIQGIEHLSLGSVQTGAILLSGLFFYDIFWVFFTPVMVSVAKSFDAPIKLLFPRLPAGSEKMPFAMLGLGDIVIPGIFVALMLRYDASRHFKRKYFVSAFGGYVLGLGTTIAVMVIFNAAQPALLYIVPAVLGAVGAHAAIRNEFSEVFNFSESPDTKNAAANAAAQVSISDAVASSVAPAGSHGRAATQGTSTSHAVDRKND
ncbi:hypothetical protein WJX74_004224 [Apatococcus lobatus]|uniref:Signal peptide peptidase n=1 Tax=Apatococcus lobatus TaxID=904363 RepID=A0AAW1QGY8_9CHLO